MKITHLSDTHNAHRKIKSLPKADIIIHSGDVSFAGSTDEIVDFIEWFVDLDYEYKIFIAGNHDSCLEEGKQKDIQKFLPKNCYYLCHSGVKINNLLFWGMPLFLKDDLSGEYFDYIEKIPKKVDVLITHRPPLGVLDNSNGIAYGCSDLLDKVNVIKPKIHLFGHIHDAYGTLELNNIRYYNAALMDEKYNLTNEPFLIEI